MKTNFSRRTASARSRKFHHDHPYIFEAGGTEHRVDYEPGESTTGLFGGNSNWRGPVWFPINYLIIEALERYHHFYGDDFKVECPTGSGNWMTLKEVAQEISSRLAKIFLPDASGRRPAMGRPAFSARSALGATWFCSTNISMATPARGLGASHQTGWTALAIRNVEEMARRRG